MGILSLVSRIQSFIAMISGAPDLVFDAAMNDICAEALDDKVSRVFRTHVEALGVVFVDAAKVFQHWVGRHV